MGKPLVVCLLNVFKKQNKTKNVGTMSLNTVFIYLFALNLHQYHMERKYQ